jgi:hypothetical protein
MTGVQRQIHRQRAGTDFNTLADDGVAALRMLAAISGSTQAELVSGIEPRRLVIRARRIPFAAGCLRHPQYLRLTTPDVQMHFA